MRASPRGSAPMKSPRYLMLPRRIAPDVPDNAQEMVALPPIDNVYSYLMFTLPLENAKNPGRMSWTSILASGLALVSLLFQGILLYSIFRAVVVDDVNWRESIMGPPDHLAVLPTSHASSSCNTGGSLCSKTEDGNFTCAPPSVQLTGRWSELDTDGDGLWTREEVEAARDDLMCKYAVDPIEVFDVFVKFLLKREEHIWIHPDLRAGKYIAEAYFTYAKGDLIMCGYRDANMCANLLKRGVFEVPLNEGTAPRVGTTIDSALDYCYGLLEPGGTCERTLPSTYSVWKKSSVDQCLGTEFNKYVYTNAKTGKSKSLLTVDYSATQDYTRASSSMLFITFKTIVIFLFFIAMWNDLKDIIAWIMWVLRYPAASEFDGEEVNKKVVSEETGDCSYEIQAVSVKHRVIMGVIVVLRIVMNFALVIIGETFLQKDTDWVNLLLNGVALVFVLDISTCLYGQLVDSDSQENFSSVEPMRVEVFRWMHAHPALRDIIAFFMIAGVLSLCMFLHYSHVAAPLNQALECACLSRGDQCREARSFDNEFWDKYWAQDVPAVFDEIDRLKAGVHDFVQSEAPHHGKRMKHGRHTLSRDIMGRSVMHGRHNKQHRVDEVSDGSGDEWRFAQPTKLRHQRQHHEESHPHGRSRGF